MTKSAAIRAVLLDAYDEAEAGLGFAMFRMVGYSVRRLCEQRFGIPADEIGIDANDVWGYVLKTLPDTHPDIACQLGPIYKEPRGVGYEPHTDRQVRFGTEDVRSYVASWRAPDLSLPDSAHLDSAVPTFGPEGRYSGILCMEKNGLVPVVQAAQIGEAYDLMVASTMGQGVDALKELIEEIAEAHPGVTVYLVHDFDIEGTSIAACLGGKDSIGWRWSVDANVVDLGLRLADVRHYGAQDESVSGMGDRTPLLRENGCSDEEIAYLVQDQWTNERGKVEWSGRRAELNGLIGSALIEFIRDKLDAAGARKVIPDDATLAEAYRLAVAISRANDAIAEALASLPAENVAVPVDLHEQVAFSLHEEKTLSWDAAIARIAEENR